MIELTFQRSGWITIGLTAIGAALVALSYLKLDAPVPRRFKVGALTLKLCALALISIALLKPTLVSTERVMRRSDLIVLIDRSESMSIPDAGGRPRLELAKERLKAALEMLRERFNLQIYSFGSDLRPVKSLDEVKPDSPSTEIVRSIESAINAWRGGELSGVILISDGVDTSGRGIPSDLPVPIYAVGVGSPWPPRDVAVASVYAPSIAYTDRICRVRVFVRSRGYGGEKVQLTIRRADGGEEIRRLIELREGLTEVEFKLKPASEGSYTYLTSLPTLPGELSDANNRKLFTLKVVRSKLKVLAVESTPRWEFAFLRRALDRDPNLELSYLVIPPKDPEGRGYIPVESGLKRFPGSLTELMGYDVLIVGDLDSGSLSADQFDMIARYVERGGGIIFLPGKRALGPRGLGGTALRRVLPVTVPPQGCIFREEEFNPTLTLQGVYHPAMRLEGTAEANAELWRDLPPLEGIFTGFSLKPGAIVLAEYKAEADLPVILFQRYGSGKVLFIAAEGLWGWDFKIWGTLAGPPRGKETPYRRFWAQAIRWIGTKERAKLVSASLQKGEFRVGEEAVVTIEVYDETLSPVSGADVRAAVKTPYGKSIPLTVREAPGSEGIYIARHRLSREGGYLFEVEARYGGALLGREEVRCEAQGMTLEFENPALDEGFLRGIARASGGEYLTVDQLDRLPDAVKAEERFVTMREEREIWDTPLLLAALSLILGAEWVIRRRRDLM